MKIDCTDSINEKLDKLIGLTADFWNEWNSIPEHEKHPSDNNEMCIDIHHIQNRLLAFKYQNTRGIKYNKPRPVEIQCDRDYSTTKTN